MLYTFLFTYLNDRKQQGRVIEVDLYIDDFFIIEDRVYIKALTRALKETLPGERLIKLELKGVRSI